MSIRIDGSAGEGGGQILRTSLSLSLVTGKPFRIERIRAGRAKPGLLRQHLTAVLAAKEISGSSVEGATLGSTELSFTPGKVRAGEYRFAVGTAGSGTLVFQTILPALMLAEGRSRVVIEGGTHNHAAPPYDFLARTFLPLIERMGPKVTMKFERYGFYPAGGGRFIAEVQPVKALTPIEIPARDAIVSRRVIAIVANLSRSIAQREVETAANMLNWGPESHSIESTRDSSGPGNVIMIEIGSEQVTEIFTDFGAVGISAEQVASNAARQALEYLASRAAVGEHLADQLLLPMVLANSGKFAALKLNMHARTNISVIEKFLPVQFELTEHQGFDEVACDARS